MRAAELEGRVAVVSPHLDDGVFSLGAAIARAARRGADVTVLTVLAGDPGSEAAAGPWDARAGFRTAGEAAAVRREEDRRACTLVGANPVWLPFGDVDYERGGDDETVWTAIAEVAAGTDTLVVPGFPLSHEDHAWLAGLVLERAAPEALVLYVEQPYAAVWTGEGERTPPARPDRVWRPLAATLRDRAAKVRACRAYASQLPVFGRGTLRRVVGYEAAQGGEAAAWPGGTASAYLR